MSETGKSKAPIVFGKEQAMLHDIAKKFFAEKWSIESVRERLEVQDGFDRKLWDEMTDLGWHSMAIPEEYGGVGLGLTELVALVEPMGRALFAGPFVATQLVAQTLIAGASLEQKNEVLPKLAEGAIAAVAIAEASGDWRLDEAQALECRGERSAGQVTLSGAKTFVTDAPQAEYFLVSFADNGAVSLALIHREQLVGSLDSLEAEVPIDKTRKSYTLRLDGVAVPEDACLTGEASKDGLEALWRAATLLVSAEACGGIAGALDVILAYLKERIQFGKPIGSYQALKHPTVDALVGLERSRSHLYHAATLLDCEEASDTDREIALRCAKAESGDAFVFAADRGIQFHGGVGFTWECDAQLYLRRALWCQHQFGDANHHRARLAELLLDS